MPAWPDGDPSVVIRDILAQTAYRSVARTTATPPSRTLLETLWQWLTEHVLRPLLGPIARAVAGSHGVGTALGIALVGIAVIGIALVTVRLVVASARVARVARTDALAERRLNPERSALQWRVFAHEAARRGDFELAIAALFAAALSLLDESAIVAFDAARTPGEYRRAVRGECALAAASSFDELADRFVRAAYAAGTADADDFDVAERALCAFEPALAA